MKRIVFALVALAVAGISRADDAAALYAKKCASCHGKDGKGTAVGQKMGAKDLNGVAGSEADIAKSIAAGKGKMKGYKDSLSGPEIESLAKYIKAGLK